MDTNTQYRKLNVGCGTHIKQGWVNLDIAPLPGVDVVHNIEHLPLPFEDGSFDEVMCEFVLEHVQWPPVFKEIHRIMAPGGKLTILVPHFTSKQNYTDPQHVRLFSIETFDFYIPTTKTYQIHPGYFDFHFSSVAHKEITFELSSRLFFFNKFVKKWVNKTAYRQQLYESLFLSRIFPAENIIITLIKEHMAQIDFTKAEQHPKGWGEEIWIINTDKYCGKLLKFNKGASFSDHYHINKDETWYVLSGKLELRHYNLSNADRLVQTLEVGDVAHIPPSTPHQLIALEDSVVIEVSTPHDEADSYRIGKGDSQKK